MDQGDWHRFPATSVDVQRLSITPVQPSSVVVVQRGNTDGFPNSLGNSVTRHADCRRIGDTGHVGRDK
jgi:hypothetical protein